MKNSDGIMIDSVTKNKNKKMQEKIETVANYLNVTLEITENINDFLSAGFHGTIGTLNSMAESDRLCPKCAHEILVSMKTDIDLLAESLKEEREQEIGISRLFSDNIQELILEFENGGYDLKYCLKYQEQNN
jgi:fructose-1,6-bisphosphatase